MSLSKLWTALKGGANEVTESIVDTQSIRILDQEMREAKKELIACDQNLTKIMAKRKLSENKVNSLQAEVDKYSQHALTAADKGDESLAIECAERVGELENDLQTERDILAGFKSSEVALKSNISKAKVNVRRMEQQIEQIKATESVQKAQLAVSSRNIGANSRVQTAVDSLERIKAKQAERSAQLEAANELAAAETGSDLDAKLRAAGVTPGASSSGKDKLAELMAKRQA